MNHMVLYLQYIHKLHANNRKVLLDIMAEF